MCGRIGSGDGLSVMVGEGGCDEGVCSDAIALSCEELWRG